MITANRGSWLLASFISNQKYTSLDVVNFDASLKKTRGTESSHIFILLCIFEFLAALFKFIYLTEFS